MSYCALSGHDLNYWHSIIKAVSFYLPLGSIWIIDILPITAKLVSCCISSGLNLCNQYAIIKLVSYCISLGLNLNNSYAIIKSHSECELLCLLGLIWITDILPWKFIQTVNYYVSFGAQFESLIFCYKILSSEWVTVYLLGLICIIDVLS